MRLLNLEPSYTHLVDTDFEASVPTLKKVEAEWLSKITNIPATIVSIGFKLVDNATQRHIPQCDTAARHGEGRKRTPISRQRTEKAADDGEKILMQFDRECETVWLMNVMPIAKDDRIFKKSVPLCREHC